MVWQMPVLVLFKYAGNYVNGAFWEDPYHATTVESGEHLLRCIVYIDLDMVRARVVNQPSEWTSSGYC
jgi:putative transposase